MTASPVVIRDLVRRYEEEGHSLRKIATAYGRGKEWVRHHLLAAGVMLVPNPTFAPVDVNSPRVKRAIDAYLSSDEEVNEIAARFDVMPRTLYRWISKAGKSCRRQPGKRINGRGHEEERQARDANLIRLYVAGETVGRISAVTSVDRKVIGRVIAAAGVPLRPAGWKPAGWAPFAEAGTHS